MDGMDWINLPFNRERTAVLKILATRRRCVEVLQDAQDRHDYGTATKCRKLIAEIEHDRDLLECMQEYGLSWDD